jgi:hypothetical protein
MNPSEFLDTIERLLSRLRKASPTSSFGQSERTHVRSVIGAWFEVYQPSFLGMLGDKSLLQPVDDGLQALLKTVGTKPARRTVIRMVNQIERHFADNLLVPLSRAYWSRVPQKTRPGRDEEVAARLVRVDPDLAESYEQVVLDLDDGERLTYRAPAAELREILTGVLHKLAPSSEVEKTDWYKEARRSGTRKEPTPTRAERTKFILRSRMQGSTAVETAESYMESVEERLANVVNATYRRGSAATHTGSERVELGQLLQYVNALLRELLPSA